MATEITGLDDLVPDTENANDGTDQGREMVARSVRELGAGRSIVVDAEGRVLAGNKTLEAARAAGLDVQVVESDGSKLVVVQRCDLDLEGGDARARELAYLDNRAGELGLRWSVDQIVSDLASGVDMAGVFSAAELDMLCGEDAMDGGGDWYQAHKEIASRAKEDGLEMLSLRVPPEMAQRLRAAVGTKRCTASEVLSAGLDHYDA